MSSITGTVRWLVSKEVSTPPCKCCHGAAHHFATDLDLDEPVNRIDHLNNEMHWLFDQLHQTPDGSRVRITLEVL